MPNGAFLYADQLNEVLTAKSEQGGFKELVRVTETTPFFNACCRDKPITTGLPMHTRSLGVFYSPAQRHA